MPSRAPAASFLPWLIKPFCQGSRLLPTSLTVPGQDHELFAEGRGCQEGHALYQNCGPAGRKVGGEASINPRAPSGSVSPSLP